MAQILQSRAASRRRFNVFAHHPLMGQTQAPPARALGFAPKMHLGRELMLPETGPR
jgi:hypothetical protein